MLFKILVVLIVAAGMAVFLLMWVGKLPTVRITRGAFGMVLASVLLIAFWPWREVPTGYRGVITQFGEIKGIQPEGLHFIPPWQNLNIFNVRAEEASVDNSEGSTIDTQPVNVSLTVRYSIVPDKVALVFEQYSHDGNLARYVETATQEVFKAVTARYSAPDLISKRDTVATDVRRALQAKLDLYGAQVINIDMRNFRFSDSYMKAINEKATQEQLAQAAVNKLKTVEAEQKQKIVVAEAEAKATVATSTAQAESLRIQNEALARNKDVLELRRIEVEKLRAEKWDGKLPVNLYGSAPIPFIGAVTK